MFTSLKARLIVAGVVLSAAFILGWTVQGWRLGEDIADFKRKLAEAYAETLIAEREAEQAQQARSDAIAESILAELAAEAAEARVIEKEVIRYVQVSGAGECNLLDDWVYIHDAAARGASAHSDAAGIPDAGAGHFTDIDALTVVTDNYEICRVAIAQVRGWQAWYEEVVVNEN